jgi:hypothetical protein
MDDKPLDSNSSLRTDLHDDHSDSDPESTNHQKSSSANKAAQRQQIRYNNEKSGHEDPSDSDPESTKHQKSSSINKPAQRKQIRSNKDKSGHEDVRPTSKTKLFKTQSKKQDNGPKFEDQYCLVDDSSKKRKAQQQQKKA